MTIFKCKMCGGTIEFEPGATVGVCDSCGTKQTLPKLDDDRRANLYDRANHFRRNNEFDKAAGLYEQILNEDNTDSETYWSLVLCRYGIEYVEDPATRRRVPTVNRAQFTSIFDDDNYKSALKYADGSQRELYEKEANTINEIQKGILAISQKEEPFDVFICYKETDNNGRRTPDSVLANDLYHQLTQEGFKVFFSRITLEDKLGTAYEPYIFAALNSAKVMVVLGTRPEYFNAVWVKNEWSRYLGLVKTSGGKKVLIPAYRDMDPYDLPEEFSHLQAQDMSKLGFMQDLTRGIKKVVTAEKNKVTGKETVVVTAGNANATSLLRRAFLFLEDGSWQEADDYCERVLDIDPENAEAYLAKLMSQCHVRKEEDLARMNQPLQVSVNYQKAIRFGSEKIKNSLTSYNKQIIERNEQIRLTNIYNNALLYMNSSHSESEFKYAESIFKSIAGFKDADKLAQICQVKAGECRKDAVYYSAFQRMKEGAYEDAIAIFRTVPNWRDANAQILVCQTRISEILAKNEAAKKAAKKRNRTFAIVAPILVACIAFVIVLTTVIIPNQKYNAAVELFTAGKYEEAIAAFTALNGHKDSAAQIEKCETAIKDEKYAAAVELYTAGKYEEAIAAFTALNGHKDSAAQIEKCETAIKDEKYAAAVELYTAGKYEEAIAAFTALNGHKDSAAQIEKCETAIRDEKYNKAMVLLASGDYEEAYALLEKIGNNDAIASSKYDRAVAMIDSGDYEGAYILLNGLNYKDSVNKLDSIKLSYEKILLSKAQVGDYIVFGSYEQDNNISNGKEDVEWLVLARKGDRVLVISRYALDWQKYFLTDVTWETCSLRTWLNGTFISNAFSADEQAMIQNTTVTADENPSYGTSPGNDTTDKVFLLSITEVNEYFRSDEERKCAPTDYVIAQGAFTSDDNKTGGKATCWWWLRSPDDFIYVAGVDFTGSVVTFGCGVYNGDGAVRPALWIDLGA